jgi:hypothetical protein
MLGCSPRHAQLQYLHFSEFSSAYALKTDRSRKHLIEVYEPAKRPEINHPRLRTAFLRGAHYRTSGMVRGRPMEWYDVGRTRDMEAGASDPSSYLKSTHPQGSLVGDQQVERPLGFGNPRMKPHGPHLVRRSPCQKSLAIPGSRRMYRSTP